MTNPAGSTRRPRRGWYTTSQARLEEGQRASRATKGSPVFLYLHDLIHSPAAIATTSLALKRFGSGTAPFGRGRTLRRYSSTSSTEQPQISAACWAETDPRFFTMVQVFHREPGNCGPFREQMPCTRQDKAGLRDHPQAIIECIAVGGWASVETARGTFAAAITCNFSMARAQMRSVRSITSNLEDHTGPRQ